MCIIFIAVAQHARYPLIIAANRDERHARASEAMHYWPDEPGILAGRDRRAGGTWFGVSAGGRVAAVANRHTATAAATATAADGGARSRGDLTARFLRHSESVAGYGEFLHDAHRDFNPFNLVYGAPEQLYCFSGGGDDGDTTTSHPQPLKRGFHAISNGAPGDPWPKMSRGVSLLKARISSDRAIDSEDLARMMKDQTTADDDPVPDTADPDKYHSPIFITGADYGTRTTTLLLGARERFDLYEYNYAPDGSESNRRHYSLAIDCSLAENTA